MHGVYDDFFLHAEIVDHDFVACAAFSDDGADAPVESAEVHAVLHCWFGDEAHFCAGCEVLHVAGDADFSAFAYRFCKFVSRLPAVAAHAFCHKKAQHWKIYKHYGQMRPCNNKC